MPRQSTAFAIIFPWLCYIGIMTLLSLVESNVRIPMELYQIGGQWYNTPDVTFNLIALFGLIAAVLWSVRAAKFNRDSVRRRAGRTAGILAGSFFGPLLATVAVFVLANDVDGILWMGISPAVGLTLAAIALVIVAIIAWRRSSALSS